LKKSLHRNAGKKVLTEPLLHRWVACGTVDLPRKADPPILSAR